MNAPLPHHYEVVLAVDGAAGAVLSGGLRPALRGGPPAEFGGRADWWSPEHLLVASAALCFWSTFQSVAGKFKLTVDGFQCRAEGILDKTLEGVVFTSIALEASLTVPAGEEERAQRLLETAKKHCIVSNSLKRPVTLTSTIRAAGPSKPA